MSPYGVATNPPGPYACHRTFEGCQVVRSRPRPTTAREPGGGRIVHTGPARLCFTFTTMATRSEIKAELERTLADFEAGVRALSPSELVNPCTDSEVPGADRWTPKDHVAHVIRVEEGFLTIARRALAGEADPIGFSAMGASREEVAATIHRDNQRHIEALRPLTLDEVLAQLATARAATLAFIDGEDEAALATPVPGSQWGDGTIGGMLARNAVHEINHLNCVKEALGQA
jgi:hypothetical protein